MMWAWWQSRSSSDTAVGWSGRKRPHLLERAVGADRDGAVFVGGGDESEQELTAGVIERSEADLVNNDEVVAADLLDGFADGVVGDGAVEVLDEVDGGEVADLVAGGDGGPAETDEVVAFAGAGRSNETQIDGVVDPLERHQVVVAGTCDGGLGEVELVQRLVDREPCGGHSVAGHSIRRGR